MTQRRRDWRRLSEIRPEFPSAPGAARRIAVRNGWLEVAGEHLAGRLPALERSGDCLVLSVPTRGWLRALPALEARLAPRFSRVPALRGVRRLDGRLDEHRAGQTDRLSKPSVSAVRAQPEDTRDARARLEALAERLLARTGRP